MMTSLSLWQPSFTGVLAGTLLGNLGRKADPQPLLTEVETNLSLSSAAEAVHSYPCLGLDAVAACWRFGLAIAGPELLESELEPDSSGKSQLVNTYLNSILHEVMLHLLYCI